MKITTLFNKIPGWLVFFGLLGINFLHKLPTGGEEIYLQLAKQFYSPEWMPDSQNLELFAGFKLLYQYIAGYMLTEFSFEMTALLGRLVLCFLIAFPLARLGKLFELSNIESAFLLQVFFFGQQAFLANSTMLVAFEPAGLSWLFGLWAVYFLLKNQFNISVILTALTTWLHFSIGSSLFILTFVYLLFNQADVKKLFFKSLTWLVLVLPLIWYLVQDYFANTSAVSGNTDLMWVYLNYPFSGTPFYDWNSFIADWLPGVLFLLSWLAIVAVFFSKLEHNTLKRTNLFNTTLLILLLLSIVIMTFDNTGNIARLLPIELNSLAKLMIVFQVAMVIKLWLVERNFLPYINAVFLLLLLPFVAQPIYQTAQTWLHTPEPVHAMNELASYIRGNTPQDAIFLFYDNKKESHFAAPLTFNRKTQRDQFVAHRWMPVSEKELQNWYQRLRDKEKLRTNFNHLFELRRKYKVDYVVSPEKVEEEGLDLKFASEAFYLYKLQ